MPPALPVAPTLGHSCDGKRFSTAALVGFVALCVAALVAKNVLHQQPAASGPPPAAGQEKLIVYCFHAAVRCPLCLNMEAYTRDALQSGFPDQLRSGRIELRVLDVQQPENEHFCQDYQLVGPAIVVVRLHRDGTTTWDNLIEAVALQRDKARFIDFLRRKIREEGGGRRAEGGGTNGEGGRRKEG